MRGRGGRGGRQPGLDAIGEPQPVHLGEGVRWRLACGGSENGFQEREKVKADAEAVLEQAGILD